MVATKTKKQTHELPRQTTETERPSARGWDEASYYVTNLTNEPDFIAYIEDQGFDIGSIDYADALSSYTDATLEQQEGLIDEQTATRIRLIANAPYITYASLEINELKRRRMGGRKLPTNEWNRFNALKHQAVWYNQMLNDYMYINDGESFSAIAQATTEQTLDHFPSHTHQAATTMEGILRGARTEAATRHLFDDAAIPYRPATAEEDLRGADVMLTMPDGEYAIDIKKSLDQLAENDGGYDFEENGKFYSIAHHGNHKKILLFPGFTESDLGDSVRLSAEITNQRKDKVRAQLSLAWIEARSA